MNDGLQSLSIPARVYYEDTDASGVAYHTAYLRYFERARTEWMRARGLSHRQIEQELGVAFTVTGLSVDYLRPARLDDALVIEAAVGNMRRASLDFVQNIRYGENEIILARARVRVACVDTVRFRPCRLPAALRRLAHSEDREQQLLNVEQT